jgi:hypothetical protein
MKGRNVHTRQPIRSSRIDPHIASTSPELNTAMLLPVYNPEIPIAGLRRHNAVLRTDAYVGNRDMRTKQLIGSIG